MAIQVPTVKVYYGTPMLPDVSRVLACLYEKDVKFDLVDMYQGQQMNPNLIRFQVSQAHVVGFEDGDTQLFESRKICRHIVNTYTDRGNNYLLGRDLLERASIEQWLKSEEHSFDPPSYTLILNLAFGFEPDRTIIPESEHRLSKILDVYEQRLGESKFLAGDEFSLADLSHLPNSHYLSKSDKWGHLFDSRRNVKNWCNEMSSRNSWQEVIKILNDYGIGGKKIKVNSKDSYQFSNNKKLDTHLPKDDRTLAMNSDKDKRSDARYNSEQNNKLENEEKTGGKLDSDESTVKLNINQTTQSSLPGSSSGKQTQEKAEITRIPHETTGSTESTKVTGDNQTENSQKGKDQASDMKLRKKEERDAQLKAKKDDQSSQNPNVVANNAKPPAAIQNETSDTVKKDQDAKIKDKTDNELSSKSPTDQEAKAKVSTPVLNEKENPNAGEVASELKSKENQDQNNPKEKSKENPRDAQSMPQVKTPELSNHEENENRDISCDGDADSKNNSNVTENAKITDKTDADQPKPNGNTKVSPTVLNEKENPNAGEVDPDLKLKENQNINGPKEESKETLGDAQSRPQEKAPDMSNQQENKNENITGDGDVKNKDDSQKAVPENNGKPVLKENPSEGQQNAKEKPSTESPEKLQDDKSSQTNKEETGPDKGKDTTGDSTNNQKTSTEPKK